MQDVVLDDGYITETRRTARRHYIVGKSADQGVCGNARKPVAAWIDFNAGAVLDTDFDVQLENLINLVVVI